MKKIILSTCIILLSHLLMSQEIVKENHKFLNKITIGARTGLGTAYTDNLFVICIPASLSFEVESVNRFYLRMAPEYTWLVKWNEHYLTLPLQIKKQFGEHISLFAGPCITWEPGSFHDWGLSGGIQYQISDKSSIILSAFTFDLNAYCIDYRFVPVGITYNFNIFQK